MAWFETHANAAVLRQLRLSTQAVTNINEKQVQYYEVRRITTERSGYGSRIKRENNAKERVYRQILEVVHVSWRRGSDQSTQLGSPGHCALGIYFNLLSILVFTDECTLISCTWSQMSRPRKRFGLRGASEFERVGSKSTLT